MNIFEYDGEEFDKKLDEIFANIDKEELKNEIIQSTYNTQNEIKKIEDNSYCIIESQQLELNETLSTINLDSNFINEEGEKEKWMEELVLAA